LLAQNFGNKGKWFSSLLWIFFGCYIKPRRRTLGAPGELLNLVGWLVLSIVSRSLAAPWAREHRRFASLSATLRWPFGGGIATFRFPVVRLFHWAHSRSRGWPGSSASPVTTSPESSSRATSQFWLGQPHVAAKVALDPLVSYWSSTRPCSFSFSVFNLNLKKSLKLCRNK
jgi:hypothetical protein